METINVFFASNDDYAQPMGVAIYSLLDNFSSKKYKIKITVLDGGISEKNKVKVKKIGETFDTQIEFIKISNEIFKDCKYIGRYTLVAYYRILIPEILEKNVEKAIYLDCDILVMGNIAKLYEINVDDYLLGAVQARYGSEDYFSSGILLMNIEKMRGYDFVQKTLDFIKTNTTELFCPDQDVLNFVCKNQWLRLDPTWNFQIDSSEKKFTPDPMIIHYATSYKPWYHFYHNYYQRDYKKYLRKWPDYEIQTPCFRIVIKQILKYVPFSVSVVRSFKKQLD